VQGCSWQFTDGTLVFLEYDPGASAPNQISLMLAANHTSTPVFVATISTTNFALLGVPQGFALTGDNSDNLYVVGQDSGDADTFGIQAFRKGSGHVWTQEPYQAKGTSQTEGQSLSAFSMVWCNTGGGTAGYGHLAVACADASGNTYLTSMDAGKAQNIGPIGGSGSIVKCTQNPFCMSQGFMTNYGTNLDISQDGRGATSGIAVSAYNATNLHFGAWGLTSSGAQTTGGGLNANTAVGTMTATTKVHLIRQSANYWVAVYNGWTTPTHLSAQTLSSSASLGLLLDFGTGTHWPANGATLSWGACPGPTGPLSEIWVFGWSSQAGHLDDLLRIPVNVTSPSAPTIGVEVTDNAAVSGGGASSDMSTLRVLKQPVDALHVDWQAYKKTSTYGLYGYFSALPNTPLIPLLTYPTSGSVVPLVATNVTLSWLFESGVVGDVQTGAYVRRQLVGSGYQWWTGAAWTAQQAGATGGAEVAVTALTTAQSVTTGTWTAANTYSYSVQTIGGTGLLSGYASPLTFIIANASPATPTLTAVYSPTINVTTLTLLGSAGGPTGSIEFSDDGVNWTFARGASSLSVYPTPATVIDDEAPAGATRRYRGQVWTAYPTSYSAYSTDTSTPSITTFWVGAPGSGVTVPVKVRRGTLNTTYPKNLTAHQALGRADAIIRSDVVGLEDGAATLWTLNASDEATLIALLNSQKVLLIQAPDGRRWYGYIDSPLPTAVPYLVGVGSYRDHAITWKGQNRPA
jgi:hypothetical protein